MSRSFSTALRPYLHTHIKPRNCDAYLRFYTAATKATSKTAENDTNTDADSLWSSVSYKKRLRQLTALHPDGENASTTHLYPRIGSEKRLSPAEFKRKAVPFRLKRGEFNTTVERKLQGKIWRVRAMGKSLLFIDVVDNDDKVQVMVDIGRLQAKGTFAAVEMDDLRKRMSVGDYYAFTGNMHVTRAGELTLAALEMPKLLAPSLHVLPTQVTDKEMLARLPQLDLILHQQRRDLIRLRHVVEQTLADFLDDSGFTKVTTPILAADTGGAAAQPFETITNEIPNVPLRLRIAPELALKKLVAANLGAVYEVGPCFRNEGLDSTHNPEFTTCEFYKPFADLETLMSMTEDIFVQMAIACDTAILHRLRSLEEQRFRHVKRVQSSFPRLRFLPTLLEKIRDILPGYRFPRQFEDTSAPELLELFARLQQKAPALKIKVPENPTTVRLLDSLCAHFIEPLCEEPTFITEHPAIMSPLAKSYTDPTTGHLISARAELFIKGIEYINLYEEENDPFIQARNFLQQASGASSSLQDEFGVELRHEEIKKRLTPGQQYYIRVLEMGLPPTGGWGCGIERLVMLFGGAKRIGEVLPFGGLRSVVAMGTAIGGRGGLIIDRDELATATARKEVEGIAW